MREWWTVRYQAAGLVLLASLVLMTPLCGLMFDCGCTWPWMGLDSHCNIHDQAAMHQCPWCVSLLAGMVSLGLAVIVGLLLAVKLPKSEYDSRLSLSFFAVKRVMLGLFGFFVVALLTGYLVGSWQGYPYFILLHAWS